MEDVSATEILAEQATEGPSAMPTEERPAVVPGIVSFTGKDGVTTYSTIEP